MRRIFLFSFIILVLSCKTVPKQTARLVYGSNKFAIHKIELDESKKKKYPFFPSSFSHPVSIPEQKIYNLLSELVYVQKTNINSYEHKVFLEQDILELSKNISQILEKIDKNNFLLVVMRINPNQTVISEYQLTRFLVWNEKNGILNLFFDKVREPITCRKCSLEPQYWALPRFNFENQIFGKSFIQSTDNIHYKVSGNLVNRKWMTVDISKIQEKMPFDLKEKSILQKQNNNDYEELDIQEELLQEKKPLPENTRNQPINETGTLILKN